MLKTNFRMLCNGMALLHFFNTQAWIVDNDGNREKANCVLLCVLAD